MKSWDLISPSERLFLWTRNFQLEGFQWRSIYDFIFFKTLMNNQGQKENGPPDLLVIWHREPDENFEKLALKIT